jgi:hypothetical protein
MLIQVTQDDIDLGVQDSDANCPVANAILRQLGADMVSVGANDIVVYHKGDTAYLYDLPLEIAEWLDDFDDGEDVLPVEFELGDGYLYEEISDED